MINYRERNIGLSTTLREAFKKMDSLDKKLLIVLEKDKFVGLISAGDIQRAIIKNISLDLNISVAMRTNYKVASTEDSYDNIIKLMLEFRMEFCPVVDNSLSIIAVYFWEDIFGIKKIEPYKKFSLPVVIMAGGTGSRLKPITNVLPKPLIPIGDNSIIEDIFIRFSHHGCSDFFVSVNYKAKLIQYYLDSQNLPYNIEFFNEEKPLGTAGSLSLLKGRIKETFFVSNCDILIEQDYSEILDYHIQNKNEITIVAALKNYPLAYGTVETGDHGQLIELIEKPEITFKINSGMYILEPKLLEEIPDNEFFHITQLIEAVKKREGKVGIFPISEKSWVDIGNWEEYLKVTNALKL